MPRYIDGFVVPVPTAKLDEYRRLAQLAGEVWREYGALEFREWIAEDVKPGKLTSFPQSVNLQPDETVVFSWIAFESREHRDRVNDLVMKDPRITRVFESEPFDGKRMIYGGFELLVEA